MEYERYISDGPIEKHFLGITTPEEEEELMVNLNIFPELQVEMEEVERRMERAAFKDAPMPPLHIRAELMQKIAAEAASAPVISANRYTTRNFTVTDVKPPANKMTVHIGWKIFLIFFLSSIALSLLFILFIMQKHKG